MPPVDIEIYRVELTQRASLACLVNWADVSTGDWVPAPNECHQNVTDWCESNEGYIPVRGWMYFDLTGQFVAHSVLRAPDGLLYDITPAAASRQYPFIESGLSESDYIELVEGRGISQLLVLSPEA
jgi:hypothetical protein